MNFTKMRYTGKDHAFGRRMGYDEGGAVTDSSSSDYQSAATTSAPSNTGQEADQGSTATVTPTNPGQWSDEDEARLQATNNTMENSVLSRGLNYSLGKLPSLGGKGS